MLLRNLEKKTMSCISKLAIIAATAATIASPAFAQSFDPESGTGNVLAFRYESTAVQNKKVSVRRDSQMTARESGLHAFAMVPGGSSSTDPNNPALTGGGSLGYNQNLYNY
jgi:hypothetical protein